MRYQTTSRAAGFRGQRGLCAAHTALLMSPVFPLMLVAQARPSPYDVEAAYLYNFAKFVTWPQTAESSSPALVVCLVGKDSFGASLDLLVSNESVQGHKIVTKHLPSITGSESCQILYLGMSEEPRMVKDLAALKQKPILTVSSLPGFLERGGTIQFILKENRVRFAINLSAAAESKIVLSSELLKVALYLSSVPQEETP